MATTAILNLQLNSRKFNNQLSKSNKNVKGFGKSSISVAGVIKTIFAGAIATASWRMIKLASDAQETSDKFDKIFKGLTSQANEVSTAFARDFGLAGSTAKKLLGDTSDLLTGFGFTKSSALDLSNQVNELAVDLASFTNFSGGAEGASRALTKALLGERESVKSLGISILDKDVKEQVAIDRANGLRFATERQAKAQATLTLAIKQSKNAIGDYSATADGTANRIKLMSQRWLELQENVGKFLIDGLQVDTLIENIGISMKWLTDNAHNVNRFFTDFGNILFENVAKNLESASYWMDQYVLGVRALSAIGKLDYKGLQRIAQEGRDRDAEFLKNVEIYEAYTKQTLENSYKDWKKIEDKKKAYIIANADKAVEEAKKLEAGIGETTGEKVERKKTSISANQNQFSTAIDANSIQALELKNTTLQKTQDKQYKEVKKQTTILEDIRDSSESTTIGDF